LNLVTLKKQNMGLALISYLANQEQNVSVLISGFSTSENNSRKFLESILIMIKKRLSKKY